MCFEAARSSVALLNYPANSSSGDSLVCTNTSSLQSLRAQLFILVGNQVDAERELVDVRTLSAQIEDTDFGVFWAHQYDPKPFYRIQCIPGTPRLNRDLGYGYENVCQCSSGSVATETQSVISSSNAPMRSESALHTLFLQ